MHVLNKACKSNKQIELNTFIHHKYRVGQKTFTRWLFVSDCSLLHHQFDRGCHVV